MRLICAATRTVRVAGRTALKTHEHKKSRIVVCKRGVSQAMEYLSSLEVAEQQETRGSLGSGSSPVTRDANGFVPAGEQNRVALARELLLE